MLGDEYKGEYDKLDHDASCPYHQKNREAFGKNEEDVLRVTREILDSGASISMSGDKRWLEHLHAVNMKIKGFAGRHEEAKVMGKNIDNINEIYVPAMPEDLVLLCMRDYAKKGCVILTSEGGKVYNMTEEQKERMENTWLIWK
jgi:hypothetical protein